MEVEEAVSLVNKDLEQGLHKLGELLLERVRDKTPVRSGTAKEGWELEEHEETLTIYNDVDYVIYLELGTQHIRPVGMVSSTLREIDLLVNKAFD